MPFQAPIPAQIITQDLDLFSPATSIEERQALKLYCAEKKITIKKQNANEFVRIVARLGVFLARTGDGDPGPLVLWRGYLRLQDILLGISLAPP